MLNTMLLYHVSAKDLGTGVTLFPRIPENVASGEDETVPRICCCNNLLSCLKAMVEFPYHYNEHNQPELIKKLYVYTAHVPISKIVEPTCHQVPDNWMTGELWVIAPMTFNRTWVYNVLPQAHIMGTPYSRFILHDFNWDDEIVADRRIAQTVYGDEQSFSILTFDDAFRDLCIANIANIVFGDDPRYRDIYDMSTKDDNALKQPTPSYSLVSYDRILTQLAEKSNPQLNLDPSGIKYALDHMPVTMTPAEKLCRLLNCQPDDLVGFDNYEQIQKRDDKDGYS